VQKTIELSKNLSYPDASGFDAQKPSTVCVDCRTHAATAVTSAANERLTGLLSRPCRAVAQPRTHSSIPTKAVSKVPSFSCGLPSPDGRRSTSVEGDNFSQLCPIRQARRCVVHISRVSIRQGRLTGPTFSGRPCEPSGALDRERSNPKSARSAHRLPQLSPTDPWRRVPAGILTSRSAGYGDVSAHWSTAADQPVSQSGRESG